MDVLHINYSVFYECMERERECVCVCVVCVCGGGGGTSSIGAWKVASEAFFCSAVAYNLRVILPSGVVDEILPSGPWYVQRVC